MRNEKERSSLKGKKVKHKLNKDWQNEDGDSLMVNLKKNLILKRNISNTELLTNLDQTNILKRFFEMKKEAHKKIIHKKDRYCGLHHCLPLQGSVVPIPLGAFLWVLFCLHKIIVCVEHKK